MKPDELPAMFLELADRLTQAIGLRSNCEGWLQIELALLLRGRNVAIELEKRGGINPERYADFAFDDGKFWNCVELKLESARHVGLVSGKRLDPQRIESHFRIPPQPCPRCRWFGMVVTHSEAATNSLGQMKSDGLFAAFARRGAVGAALFVPSREQG